jgi:hypothetical protein
MNLLHQLYRQIERLFRGPNSAQSEPEKPMTTDFKAEIADAIENAVVANKAAILPVLQSLEGGVEAIIFNAVKNAPKGNGPMAVVLPLIEAQVEARIKDYVAANGPEVVFDYLNGYIKDFVKSLGG